MSSHNIHSQLQEHWFLSRQWFAFALAGAAGALACALQIFAESRLALVSFEVLLGAVAMVVIVLGAQSGFITLIVSALIRLYLFLPSQHSRTASLGAWIGFALFLAIGILICWMGGRLHRAKQTLAAALGSMPEAVVITDRKRQIQFMNPVAEALTGWSLREIAGKDAEAVIPLKHDETRSDIEHTFEDATGHCPHVAFDEHTLLLSKEGGEALIEGTESPIRDCGGVLKGVVMVFRDITRRKRAEQDQKALIDDLQGRLARVHLLSGLLPICAWCKKIRNGDGLWRQWEEYILEHSEVEFTHGFCPECADNFDHDPPSRAPQVNFSAYRD
jgi:PAS domain S-box-containing protein